MIIDFRNAIEMEKYPVSTDVKLSDDILDGYYEAEIISTPHVDGWYVLVDNKLTINLTLTVDINFKCDRCLTDVKKHFEIKVAEMFVPRSEQLDDQDEFVYDKSVIDISDLLHERLLLALPMTVLCKEDCKGLCPKCGKNLNLGKCDCVLDEDVEEESEDDSNNPFAILKDFNTNAGGAE